MITEWIAVGKWIAIRPDEKVAKSEQGEGEIHIPQKYQVDQTLGTIISLGAGPVGDDGERCKFQVEVGQRVVFSAFGGIHIKIENEPLRMVEEQHVFAIVEEEE